MDWNAWWQSADIETRRKLFVGGIVAAGAWVFWALRRARDREIGDSKFQMREADRPRSAKKGPSLAEARYAPPAKPLQLTGVRLDVPPHQLLGISERATEKEIQEAFKEQMKRYHPDRVGPAGSDAWKEAGRIAQAMQDARTTLLERARQGR